MPLSVTSRFRREAVISNSAEDFTWPHQQKWAILPHRDGGLPYIRGSRCARCKGRQFLPQEHEVDKPLTANSALISGILGEIKGTHYRFITWAIYYWQTSWQSLCKLWTEANGIIWVWRPSAGPAYPGLRQEGRNKRMGQSSQVCGIHPYCTSAIRLLVGKPFAPTFL